MNYKKIKIFSVLVLASLLLTACTGLTSNANWPGVSLDPSQKFVYTAYGTYVFKVDATNGSMIWRYPDAAGAKQFYAPPGSNDTLVVAGDIEDGLSGLDATKPTPEKWTNTLAKGKWIAGSIIVNNTIVAPSSDGNVYAISSDGNKLWNFTGGGPFWATPASDGKIVYAPSMDHFLYALNLSDGSLVWKKDMGAASVYGMTLDKDGTIYLSTLANQVLAINASNGDIKWRFSTKGNLWAVPVVNKGLVYVGDLSNKVYAILASDGSSKWEVDGGAPITSSPAITPDGMIFAAETGVVFHMDFSGAKSWSQTINSGKLYSTPVVTAGNLVVVGVLPNAATDPILVAYDFTGAQKWAFTMPK